MRGGLGWNKLILLQHLKCFVEMLACCDMVKGGVEWFLLQLVCCSLCGSHTVLDNFVDEVEGNDSLSKIHFWILQHCKQSRNILCSML